MSNLALRLKRLWVDWCEHNKPDNEHTEWPGEAFLFWAAKELRVELVGVLGDDQQCELLRSLAPHVQERWPVPVADREPTTEPDNKKPSTLPPFVPFRDSDREDLLGIGARVLNAMRTPRTQVIDDKRPDMAQRGKLSAHSTLDLTFEPRTYVSVTWIDGQCTPFNLLALERVSITSITVRGDETMVQPAPLLFMMGRQNEGLLRLATAAPGDAIRFQLSNDSDTDLDVELRLHGLEPAKESETA